MKTFRRFPRMMAGLYVTLIALICIPFMMNTLIDEGPVLYAISIIITTALIIYSVADRWNYEKKPYLVPKIWLLVGIVMAINTIAFTVGTLKNNADEIGFLYFYIGTNIIAAIIEEIFINKDYTSQTETYAFEVNLSDYPDYALETLLKNNQGHTILIKGIINKAEMLYDSDFSYAVHLKSKNHESKITVICYFNSKQDVKIEDKFMAKGILSVEEDEFSKTVYKLI